MRFQLRPGQFVRFTYRRGINEPWPEDRSTQLKEVLILNPNYRGRVHAIDMRRLTSAEQEVLRAVMVRKRPATPHRIPLVNDILARGKPVDDIRNPQAFYQSFVKVFLRDKDAYRQYYPRRMAALRLVKKSEVEGPVRDTEGVLQRKEREAASREDKQKSPKPVTAADKLKAATDRRKKGGAKPAQGARPSSPAQAPTGPQKTMGRLELMKQRAAALKAQKDKEKK